MPNDTASQWGQFVIAQTIYFPLALLIASFQPLFSELMSQLCANIQLLLHGCRGASTCVSRSFYRQYI